MISTNMSELMQIVNGEHANPHNILGKHVKKSGEIILRVFNPDADKVEAFDERNPSIRIKFDKEHQSGFFVAIMCDDIFKGHRYKLKFTSHKPECTVWEMYDPYCFSPTMSELDLYLFGNGTHYEIYNKLGAVTCEIDGVKGVAFAVWAPNAKRVSVVGDFNVWNGLRNPMRALGSSGIWEVFIPGVRDYDRYKFEINAHSGVVLQKADPYANFAELRPGTASMTYDIGGYSWKDKKWMTARNKNNPLDGPMNVYELHVGSWRRVADDNENRFFCWAELAKEVIPYVVDMGYTHIELMPITEYPFDGSWGYQVTGYFAPSSRYGSPHEFMQFVDACHQSNIGVILDWVPAHFPKDAHGLAAFDGSCLYEHADPRKGEHPEWGTLIFNFGRNEVKNFLIGSALFWLDKYHIDGLRVDAVASMLYLNYGKDSGNWVPNEHGGHENTEAVEFVKHMNSIISQKHPNVLMIAEESTAWQGVTKNVSDDGLGFALKWNMGWMNDFLKYMSMDSVYRKHHHHMLTFSMVYAYSEKYMLALSHDEVVHGKYSLINKMPGDTWQKFANLRTAYAFMIGHPGKKLLFMGGEFAQYNEWSEEKSLDWHLVDEVCDNRNFQSFVRDINHLYLSSPALWEMDFDPHGFAWISCNNSESSAVSFCRRASTGEHLVFACNFTPVAHLDYHIGLPMPGGYSEILNTDASKYGGSNIVNPGKILAEEILCDGCEYSTKIKLPPLGVVVLKLEEGSACHVPA